MHSDRCPKVSVIIPVHNTSGYIGQTLDSIFAQTYPDFEVILINDGSTDTPELIAALEPYQGRIVYLEQENRGPAAARNAGIRVARGEYVAFLDSDDLWEPDYLAEQMSILEKDPRIDVLYPNARIFGDGAEAGRTAMELSPSEGPVTLERVLDERCNIPIYVTARRHAVVRAGLFDEAFLRAEDYELWVRMLKTGARFEYHAQPLVRYRVRPDSLSSNTGRQFRAGLQVLDKVERTMALTPPERDALREARRRFTARLHLTEAKEALFRGDTTQAIERLRDSNRYFRRHKLSLVILLLRLAPGLTRRAYELRDRLVFASMTHARS
ncbi:MAG: glycosyltransferase family 2 protein [Microbispora sp.]|nr:glycosyltransferase family 2 protein [Microbispora sp.]